MTLPSSGDVKLIFVSTDPLRYEYSRSSLAESELLKDPLQQLAAWLQDARKAGVTEPTAMSLATVGPDHRPSSRMVLLRGLDERGLIFYTNYESRKGHELAENEAACVNFWWGETERQVRVEGFVSKLAADESDAYFAARPRESQIASAASPQSRAVANREELEQLVHEVATQYPNAIPRPAHWGGYVLTPDRFEFWQGRPARLHDRLILVRTENGWNLERLAP